jgi:hypothetical protein
MGLDWLLQSVTGFRIKGTSVADFPGIGIHTPRKVWE